MVGNTLNGRGYNQEEKYFYERNLELLEKRREKLDGVRREKLHENQKESYWLRCPKCGNQMKEEKLAGILIDKCTDCKGLYFDNGELETLLESKDSGSFLKTVKRIFMNEFIKSALVKDIPPGKGQVVEVSGTKVAIFNQDGKFHAIDNTCLHKKGSLGEGKLEGSIVECPLHSWKYDIRNGQCETNPNLKVECYEVKVDGQDILIKV